MTNRVQGKAKKHEATDAREWGLGLRLRGHPAAKRFAASNEGNIRQLVQRSCYDSADRCLRYLRRVGSLDLTLHEGKLVAQTGDAAHSESRCDCNHERMLHAGSGAVCQHKTSTSRLWLLQQARNVNRFINRNA